MRQNNKFDFDFDNAAMNSSDFELTRVQRIKNLAVIAELKP